MTKPAKQKVHHWPSIISIVFYMFLLTTRTTDADLFDSEFITGNKFTATTLDFSGHDTATNRPQTNFFNINGLMALGYKISAIKLRNMGQQGLTVSLFVETIANQNNLCPHLYIKILDIDLNPIYDGDLAQAQAQIALPQAGSADLIFLLGSNLTENDPNSTVCDFDVILDSRLNQDQAGGFYDREILQNHVQTQLY